jgi:uncharacterized protein YaaW (UPF0174 family)
MITGKDMDSLKHGVDTAAAVAAVASLSHMLPEIAAGLSAVWYAIRIYEWWNGKQPKE